MMDDANQPIDAAVTDSADAALTSEPTGEPVALGTGKGKLTLKRGGVETDIVFPFLAPAIIGRFDPTVGPIDIDLGALQPEGGYISRRHAEIRFEDGQYFVRDLGSANGTYVLADDFVKVDDSPIAHGVEIAFGNARFVFHAD